MESDPSLHDSSSGARWRANQNETIRVDHEARDGNDLFVYHYEMEMTYLFTTIINGAYKKEKKLENILNILLGTLLTYIPGAR